MTRSTNCLVLLVLGGPAAGQGPGPSTDPTAVMSKFEITNDPDALAKMYAPLSKAEVTAWWKKQPTSVPEEQAFAKDLVESMRLAGEACRLHAARKSCEAAAAMKAAIALFGQYVHEDSALVAQMYGLHGIILCHGGDPAGAADAFRKLRACMDKTFPPARFPDGHAQVALWLSLTGNGEVGLGQTSQAEATLRKALKMYEKFGPAMSDGSDLTGLLILLTQVVFKRGEYAEAETFSRRAVERCTQLRARHPGEALYDQLLATATSDLAAVRQFRGDTAEAKRLRDEGAALRPKSGDRLYEGIDLRNQAVLLANAGDYRGALAVSARALGLAEAAFPAATAATGHPHLQAILRSHGQMQAGNGQTADARRTLARCLDMCRRLYPDDRCPDGHPDLADTLAVLGDLYLRSPAAADQRAAAQYFRDALAISLGHTRAQAAYLSEAQMLVLMRTANEALQGLLSVAGPFDPRDYWYVWEAKAAAMRILDQRRRALVGATDPAVRGLAVELAAARAELGLAAMTPATDPAAPGAAALARRKEDLERRLAEAQGLPVPPRGGPGPAALAAALPADAAFVDFWEYLRVTQDPADPSAAGRRASVQYVAFVLTRGRPPARIDLGLADLIDPAVTRWLDQIIATPADPVREREAARRVADRVWQPVRAALPADTTTLYVGPDGAFGRLPFAALPGRDPDGVLLNEMMVVETPHGPGLHAALTGPAGRAGGGPVLAVGGVDFGPGRRPLPGTGREVAALAAAAAKGGIGPVVRLGGADATRDRVVGELTRVRVAHLATHATAAAAVPRPEAAAVLNRNPLLGPRLALAGGGTAPPGDELSAEAVAGLRLDHLDLAVLSACDTGHGTVLPGEGVFGLGRAFHAAGCRAVVASLWAVEDGSTADLMTLFYENLWAGNRAPAVALWQAQRALYKTLTDGPDVRRGDDAPGFGGVVPLPDAPKVLRSSPRKWAGFRLSISH